ncbi:uncharacterized protein LOC131686247 [Topomyia yanbarensis]|uniref:uncharacterized protein LOC131686247 n=1 Tax=Topomyia yanbarensis TaxID=2498891 RepID=UPI00273CAFE9|nr:uncharacterized protein LOC131686247 [Topomyia yanbarensis]
MDAAALRSADLQKRHICRFCLQSSEQLQNIDGDEELTLKIAASLALDVSPGDGLPQALCERCLWLVEKFNLFKDQCIRAEFLLRSFALTGIPLMHALEPLEVGCFCSRQKSHAVDVEVQTTAPEVEPQVCEESKVKVEDDSDDEVIFIGDVKEEMDDDDWNLADVYDTGTVDELAEELYEEEAVNIIQSAPFSDVEQIFGGRINIDGSIDIEVKKLEQVFSVDASENVNLREENFTPIQSFSESRKENFDRACGENSVNDVETMRNQDLDDVDSLSNQIEKDDIEEALASMEDSVVDISTEETKSKSTPTKESCPEFVDLTLESDSPNIFQCSVKSRTEQRSLSTSFSDAMQLLLEDEKLYDTESQFKRNHTHRKHSSQATPTSQPLSRENSLQTTLNTLYGDIPTAPLRESDGLDSRFINREDGEIISDDELDPLALSSELAKVRLAAPEESSVLRAPSPNSDEEFPCETCDKFFPQAHLLEIHKKAYHSNSPQRGAPSAIGTAGSRQDTVPVPAEKFGSINRKVTLTIGSPLQECPNCGEMVPKATYWMHLKSHSSKETPLISFGEQGFGRI